MPRRCRGFSVACATIEGLYFFLGKGNRENTVVVWRQVGMDWCVVLQKFLKKSRNKLLRTVTVCYFFGRNFLCNFVAKKMKIQIQDKEFTFSADLEEEAGVERALEAALFLLGRVYSDDRIQHCLWQMLSEKNL